MSTDRIAAALGELYLAYIEHHCVETPPELDQRILARLAGSPAPAKYEGKDDADRLGTTHYTFRSFRRERKIPHHKDLAGR